MASREGAPIQGFDDRQPGPWALFEVLRAEERLQRLRLGATPAAPAGEIGRERADEG